MTWMSATRRVRVMSEMDGGQKEWRLYNPAGIMRHTVLADGEVVYEGYHTEIEVRRGDVEDFIGGIEIGDEDPEQAMRNAEVDSALAFSVLMDADELPEDGLERGIRSIDKALVRLHVARAELFDRLEETNGTA